MEITGTALLKPAPMFWQYICAKLNYFVFLHFTPPVSGLTVLDSILLFVLVNTLYCNFCLLPLLLIPIGAHSFTHALDQRALALFSLKTSMNACHLAYFFISLTSSFPADVALLKLRKMFFHKKSKPFL